METPIFLGSYIFGAFYGYCGGAENDGGFFFVDFEEGENIVLGYSDVDELGETHPNSQSLFNALMTVVWTSIDKGEEEDVLNINNHSRELLGSDELYMSPGFDGDALAAISEAWNINLRFED
jgi:hypothetical protein